MNSIQKAIPGLAATPRQKRWTLASLCLMLTTIPMLLAACRPQASSSSSPVELRSDGRYRWTITRLQKVTPEYQHDWLDNRTILFIGSDESKTSGLYAWDQKSPARLVLADAYQFCFDGKAWTALVSEEIPGQKRKVAVRYGLNPADLSTTRLGRVIKSQSGGASNSYTCDEEDIPPALHNRIWRALRPSDGHLDLGIDWKHPEEVTLLKPGDPKRVSLGFQVHDPTSAYVHFSRHRGMYVLYDMGFTLADLKDWQRDGIFTIRTMLPRGDTQAISVRSGPWSEIRGGDRAIRLAKPGLIVSSKGGALTSNNNAGIYLIRHDQTFSKIDNELIESPSVSPDGCSVAYRRSIINHFSELKSINLCQSNP